MKRFLPLIITLALGQALQAQKMRDVFAAMPDSVLGIMTKNNRLDCIDFIENDMEAKVRNRFDGFSVLKALTVDYLDLQLTPNCRVEMKLLPVSYTHLLQGWRVHAGERPVFSGCGLSGQMFHGRE